LALLGRARFPYNQWIFLVEQRVEKAPKPIPGKPQPPLRAGASRRVEAPAPAAPAAPAQAVAPIPSLPGLALGGASPAPSGGRALPLGRSSFFDAFQRMLEFLQHPSEATREAFYGMLLEQSLAAMGCRRGVLYLWRKEGGGLVRAVGEPDPEMEKLCREAALTLEPRPEDPDSSRGPWHLAMPLEYEGQLEGVLYTARGERESTPPADFKRTLSVAKGLAAVLAASSALASREEVLLKLKALTQASAAINSNRELRPLLQQIMQEAQAMMRAEASSVFLIDEKSGDLVMTVAHGPKGEQASAVRLKMGEGIAGWVAEHGEPLLVPDAGSDPRFAGRVDAFSQFRTRDIICVPLKVHGRVLGVVQVLNHMGGESFRTSEVEVLQSLASMAAVAIDNATLYNDLESWAQRLNRELVDANAELEQSKTRMESILFAMEDAVVATDLEGRATLVNRVAEALLSHGGGAVLGRQAVDLVGHAAFSEAFEKVRSEGKSARLELSFSREGERAFALVVAPIKDLLGATTGTVTVLRDITDIRELDRMKTEFLNTVSHELRTPMTSIRAFSELIASRSGDPAKMGQWASIINEETERLGRLIDDLLDVSRFEAGKKMRINRAQVALGELAARALELYRSLSEKHPFVAKVQTRHLTALLDRDRVNQVISNLVTNAIKYSPAGGEVSLVFSDSADPGRVRIAVNDHGLGLSEKDRQHLFERFYRVESSYTQNIRGTGLGLAIVKHIVEQHGGEIGVESELGQGSTFWLELPVAGEAPA
jgi:two-component system phosphate regulon sensor histidine kinase PhoR